MTDAMQPQGRQPQRLAALARTLALADLSQEEYQKISRTAQTLCQAECAWISLLAEDGDRLVVGEDLPAGPPPALCQRLLEEESLILCHASEDPDLRSHPWMQRLATLAACPFHNAEGHRIGLLCVGLTAAGALSDAQKLGLCDLASLLEGQLLLRFLANSHPQALRQLMLAPKTDQDALTGLPDKQGILALLHHSHTRCRLEQRPFALALVELDPIATESLSVQEAQGMLQAAAARLKATLRTGDLLGRWQQDRLLVLLPGLGMDELLGVGDKLVQTLYGTVDQAGQSFRLSASLGLVGLQNLEARLDAAALLQAADVALQQACEAGRNRARLSPVQRVHGLTD